MGEIMYFLAGDTVFLTWLIGIQTQNNPKCTLSPSKTKKGLG